jgi:DNA-binding Lrp family transcriptional regulator
METEMDESDRRIVNALQDGLPLCERPFADAAAQLGLSEQELISRVEKLLENRTLTRFGPLFDAERLGGAFSLCAMSVPAEDFERVAALVNAHPEVAHNYERDHRYNMWFVLATDTVSGISQMVSLIESETGYPVLNLPREEEYYVGMRLTA